MGALGCSESLFHYQDAGLDCAGKFLLCGPRWTAAKLQVWQVKDIGFPLRALFLQTSYEYLRTCTLLWMSISSAFAKQIQASEQHSVSLVALDFLTGSLNYKTFDVYQIPNLLLEPPSARCSLWFSFSFPLCRSKTCTEV